MADEGRNLPFWSGKRVLLTGHTGFIGSWLSLWLHEQGAKVTGYALPPHTEPALYADARLGSLFPEIRADINDRAAMRRAVKEHQPEIILHLAAQAIVGQAHDDAYGAWHTNALGTVAVMEAAQASEALRAVIVFTTDKVYDNDESNRAWREDDRIGGFGLYDSSKGAAELAVRSFARDKLQGIGVATVRAGNVIGGGDWGQGRLVPDCIRAFEAGQPVTLRHPQSTRPWQHVLDICHATLLLAERLHANPRYSGAWNIGPDAQAVLPVSAVAEALGQAYGRTSPWQKPDGEEPFPEARALRLDSGKFREAFGWRPMLPIEAALHQTAAEYRAMGEGDAQAVMRDSIRAFEKKRSLHPQEVI